MQHGHLVAERECLAAVVGDVDHREVVFGGESAQDQPERGAQRLVERGQGLVEQQDARSRDDRPGERDALTLPTGQGVGPAPGELAQLDGLERLGDERPSACGRHLRATQRVGDVVRHAEVGPHGVVLEDHAEPAFLGREVYPVADEGAVADPDRARRGAFEPGDGAEEGGLAGTGRAHEGEDPPGVHVDIEVLEGDGLAEADADAAGVEFRHGSSRMRRRTRCRVGCSGRRRRPGRAGPPP